MSDILMIDRNEVEAVRNNVLKSLDAWLTQMNKMDRTVESLNQRNKGEAVTALVELYNKYAPGIKAELRDFINEYNETVKKTCDSIFEMDTNTKGRILGH